MSPEDIREYLLEGLEPSLQWDIYAHDLPDAPDKGIGLRGYSGTPGYMRSDNRLPADDHPRFQVLVRAKADTEAEAQAHCLHNLLHVSHALVGSTRVIWLEALQRPVLLLKDDANRYVYAFNIEAHVQIGVI